MKKYILALLMLLATPAIAGGGGTKEYWVCDQLGSMGGETVWASSGVYYSTKSDNRERELEFEGTAIDQTGGEFTPSLEPECRGFEVEDAAEKYLKWRLEKASKRKIHILWIEFSY